MLVYWSLPTIYTLVYYLGIKLEPTQLEPTCTVLQKGLPPSLARKYYLRSEMAIGNNYIVLSVIMLGVIMLGVILLSVIMLSVVTLPYYPLVLKNWAI